jgi:hypothetical protein
MKSRRRIAAPEAQDEAIIPAQIAHERGQARQQPMSASSYKQISKRLNPMSALPPKSGH